jgi:hypothetical protein
MVNLKTILDNSNNLLCCNELNTEEVKYLRGMT